MRHQLWFGLFGIALLLAGCTGGEKPSRAESKEVEFAMFRGGYGSDFFESAAQEFKSNTGVTVKVTADARVDQVLMPMFQKGSPPDLTYPGWRFDVWKAVQDGEALDLSEALAAPAYGETTGQWRDAFMPEVLALGESEGKQYLMPYFVSVMGWWYDPDLFAENGWTPPKTYQELLVLCQRIEAAGIAPITYQGQYPDYMIACMLTPWIISAGGESAFRDCQNLVPGAWKSPAVVRAASMIRELRDTGYFQTGATALSHTEAQAEFINRRAAMVPCGTWLYSEMKDALPEGRRMAFMLAPVLGDGKGEPSAVMLKIEPWFVPAKAQNPKDAIEYFKYLTSLPKAKQFVQERGTLMAIKGSNDVELPDYLQGAATAFSSSKLPYAAQWKEWYPTFYDDVGDALTEMLNGKLSPEQFAAKCEQFAELLRQNDAIVKRQVK